MIRVYFLFFIIFKVGDVILYFGEIDDFWCYVMLLVGMEENVYYWFE